MYTCWSNRLNWNIISWSTRLFSMSAFIVCLVCLLLLFFNIKTCGTKTRSKISSNFFFFIKKLKYLVKRPGLWEEYCPLFYKNQNHPCYTQFYSLLQRTRTYLSSPFYKSRIYAISNKWSYTDWRAARDAVFAP